MTKHSHAICACKNAQSVKNRLAYCLGEENNQQRRRFLCEKLQDARGKHNKQNTRPWMRLPHKLLLLKSRVDKVEVLNLV